MNNAQYVARLLNNLRTRAYPLARPQAAWGAVDAIAAECPSKARFAAILARQGYGHRPCARVGLKTKPFHVAQTRKSVLTAVGRILGGHKRVALKPY